MLKIRLQRTGRRNKPFFRVVLTDSKNSTKSGRFKDILGTYEPVGGNITLKKDEIKEWISKGAKPSDTVHNMLISEGVIEGKKINVLPKKSPVKKEEAPAEGGETPAAPEGEAAPAEGGETPVAEEPKEEAAPAEEAPKEEEKPAEAPAEEAKEETPAEEPKEEEKAE